MLCTPAGNVSITIKNFIKFLQLNINGITGANNYLKFLEHINKYSIHILFIQWAGTMNLKLTSKYSHRGSNMMFNSFAGISPEEKLGIVVMINDNEEGVTKTLRLLLNNYAKE